VVVVVAGCSRFVFFSRRNERVYNVYAWGGANDD
jgi:hypothetical protein